MHHLGTMITKACLSNWEYLVQEAVYYILLELKLRRISPALCIVNYLLEEIFQVLLSEKELDKLPDDGPRFSRDHIWIVKYVKTKCNILQWKIQCFKCFCYAEFLRYYILENKSDKSYEYQPDALDENLIETMSSPEIFLGVLVHISTVYLSRTEGSSTIVLNAIIKMRRKK